MKPMLFKVKLRSVLSPIMMLFFAYMLYACLDGGNWIGIFVFAPCLYLSADYLWEFFSTAYWQEPK